MIDLDQAKKVSSEFDKYKANSLDLYKHCQNSKCSVSDYLEELDPTPKDETGTPLVQYDAFDRHLMALDIPLSGPNQWTVHAIASQVEYLLPELVLREVKAGMQVSERFNYLDCVAAQVPSSTTNYHPLYIPNLNRSGALARRDKSMGSRARSGKGGGFPVSSIRRREKDIVITDNGRVIETDYSIIRDYGWSDIAIYLRLIGSQLAADKLQNIYDLGITGDGTVGAATNTFNGTAGTLVYTDLVRNYTQFDAPFTMDRILAPDQSTETILSMAQFQDPLSGWEFQKSGKVVTPMGGKLKQVRATPGSAPTGTVIVTLDSRFAVKEAMSQALSVEADKIIARKFEQAVVSEESVFSIIADGAITRIVWT